MFLTTVYHVKHSRSSAHHTFYSNESWFTRCRYSYTKWNNITKYITPGGVVRLGVQLQARGENAEWNKTSCEFSSDTLVQSHVVQ